MLLQRLATGATGVKQARYRRRPTRGSEALIRACAVSIYTACLYIVCMEALAVQCETTHGVYEFRRGFCTLVLSLSSVFTTRSRPDSTHWQEEKWPTVGTVNGRIGGTTVSSRRRKSLLRSDCAPTPFSRRRDWRCSIPSARSAPSNC